MSSFAQLFFYSYDNEMKLQHLFAVFSGLPEEKMSTLEVSGLFQDARAVLPGSVFVAVRGQKFDGHQFIQEAVKNGASALVLEDKSQVPADFNGFILQVPDSRQALDLLASRFYWDPGQELFCVGVTGTNGKTSITYLVESVLNQAGHRTAVMGTVNHHLGEKVFSTEMTTPDPISLQKRLKEFKELGATAVALEISSHALDQKRADSVPFNAVVYSNLTRDHLDYHGTMENYFRAKQRLFMDLMESSAKFPTFAIVNIADAWGRKLWVHEKTELLTYGTKDSDLRYEILEVNFSYTRFKLIAPWGKTEIKLPLCGVHNVLNALAAVGVGVAAGIKWDLILKGLENFPGVPGRLQMVPNIHDRHVLVDYAHSPDALENVLKALAEVRKTRKSKSKIHLVFGCGGDRDKGKRPLMAAMALKYADQITVTSDNPRTEDPEQIIHDIVQGLSAIDQKRLHKNVDRSFAIREAIKNSQADDVVLIAGKGHEDYQIIGSEKKPFSDFHSAQQALKELS